jgi:hypothetical protein
MNEDLKKLGIDKNQAKAIEELVNNHFANTEVEENATAVATSVEENDIFSITSFGKLAEGSLDGSVDNKGAISFDGGFTITPCIFNTTAGNIGAKHFGKIKWGDKYPNRPKKLSTYKDCCVFAAFCIVNNIQFSCDKVEMIEKRGQEQKKYTISVL